MTGFIKTYAEPGAQLQNTFDAAVVIPTILRSELGDALRSVFAQDLGGRIHALIGIDTLVNRPLSMLDAICEARPPNCLGTRCSTRDIRRLVEMAVSSPAGCGGVLRCILSYLANSPYTSRYLDDDNWWRPVLAPSGCCALHWTGLGFGPSLCAGLFTRFRAGRSAWTNGEFWWDPARESLPGAFPVGHVDPKLPDAEQASPVKLSCLYGTNRCRGIRKGMSEDPQRIFAALEPVLSRRRHLAAHCGFYNLNPGDRDASDTTATHGDHLRPGAGYGEPDACWRVRGCRGRRRARGCHPQAESREHCLPSPTLGAQLQVSDLGPQP